uniref:Uncharacterized protein n=1 Tax=Anguilla anguilla TaxID=7936 RepID=A0A0E9QW52_ANGAN
MKGLLCASSVRSSIINTSEVHTVSVSWRVTDRHMTHRT